MVRRCNLDLLWGTVEGIAAWLGGHVKRREPDAVPAVAEAGEGAEHGAAGALGISHSLQRVTSMAAAAMALDAVANYFGRSEPSSPALLLVRQARQMLGKSFVEALRILVPAHAEAAAINVGKDRVFRFADRADGGPARRCADAGFGWFRKSGWPFWSKTAARRSGCSSRCGAYFRNAEPSSPVPFLIDRARELAQRDFLSLLRDVLPEGALKTLDNQS